VLFLFAFLLRSLQVAAFITKTESPTNIMTSAFTIETVPLPNTMTSTFISIASELVPIPSSEALPTPTSCSPGIAPNDLNITGLTGQICQVNVPPNDVNITSCCNSDAEVRVLNDCTQWCEVDDGNEFFDCVNDMAPTSYPFPGGPCLVLSAASSTSTISSPSTGIASTPSTSPETQTPESTEASPSTTESEEDGAEATETPDVEGMYPSHLISYRYHSLLIKQDAAANNLREPALGATVLAVAATLGILAWL